MKTVLVSFLVFSLSNICFADLESKTDVEHCIRKQIVHHDSAKAKVSMSSLGPTLLQYRQNWFGNGIVLRGGLGPRQDGVSFFHTLNLNLSVASINYFASCNVRVKVDTHNYRIQNCTVSEKTHDGSWESLTEPEFTSMFPFLEKNYLIYYKGC